MKENRYARTCRPLKLALMALILMLPLSALAQNSGLPYEGGLSKLYSSMTGTVPFAISLVGIVACGAMLIFGGEISGFMRTLVFIVLVIAVIVQAASLITVITGKENPFSPAGGGSAVGSVDTSQRSGVHGLT